MRQIDVRQKHRLKPDRRYTKASLNAPCLSGMGHNKKHTPAYKHPETYSHLAGPSCRVLSAFVEREGLRRGTGRVRAVTPIVICNKCVHRSANEVPICSLC